MYVTISTKQNKLHYDCLIGTLQYSFYRMLVNPTRSFLLNFSFFFHRIIFNFTHKWPNVDLGSQKLLRNPLA